MVKRKENKPKQLQYDSRLSAHRHAREQQLNEAVKHSAEKRVKRIHLNQLQNEYDEMTHLDILKNGDSACNPRSKISFEVKGILRSYKFMF